jgi:hypothetical protein
MVKYAIKRLCHSASMRGAGGCYKRALRWWRAGKLAAYQAANGAD